MLSGWCLRRTVAALSLSALSAVPAAAWWASSHQVVAQLAYDQLRPATRAEADRLIAVLADAEPRADHFVPAAAWLDLLKKADAPSFEVPESWHFVNIPYPAAEEKPPLPAGDHVVSALHEQLAILRDPRAGDPARAFALRVVLHLVADAHQPLHCVNRVSAASPGGDLGGNTVPLLWPADPRATLHILWDDALGLYPPLRPGEDWRQVTPGAARALGRDFPRAALPEAAELEPEAWVRESHRLALEAAYPDLEPGQAPSAAYLERGRPLVRRQLALAAYRLAALLEQSLAPAD